MVSTGLWRRAWHAEVSGWPPKKTGKNINADFDVEASYGVAA